MLEKKGNQRQGLHFVTLNVAGWIDVFTNYEYCDIVINSLNFCIQNKNLVVYEYVIMSNRILMIVESKKGHLSKVLRDFRGHAARQIFKAISENPEEKRKEWMMRQFQFFSNRYQNDEEHHFWQFGNNPVALNNSELLQQKAAQVINTPVAEKKVAKPQYYIYSSACAKQQVRLASWE